MENFSKVLILLLLLLLGCQERPEDLPRINPELTTLEQLLVRTWVYEYIEAEGTTFLFATSQMELTGQPNNRNDLAKRQIVYRSDYSYQLKWSERGDYSLGTEGTANWQPNFGSWQLAGDTLIHNPGQFYETRYLVEITETNLIRTSDRLMVESIGFATWPPGTIVRQVEHLIPVQL